MTQPRQATLTTDPEWEALRESIDPKQRIPAVKNTLDQLRALGAVSVIIEEEYLDQDFSAAYSAFYSTVFKRHTKLCRRMHFFNVDVTGIVDDVHALTSARQLEEIGGPAYLGFIVVRPLAHAPLGRVVLAAPASPAGMSSELLVVANYETHVLGATLRISGIAMTQQDSRVGACAQAAIWMAGRHFHMRHRGPWFSTVAITDVATKLTDNQLSRSLPSGADLLTPDSMLRALRAMEREPIISVCEKANRQTTNDPWVVQWGKDKPRDLIGRYVDSGIPVILGFLPLQQQTVGHAVIVTGRTFKSLAAGAALPPDPTIAQFFDSFLAHDDQRGSNIAVSIAAAGATASFPYTIDGHLNFLIAPLPKKVFIAAESAEKLAWDSLRKYQGDWQPHKQAHGGALGTSAASGDAFIAELAAGQVIARTYLTYGWRYKSRIMRNNVTDDFKSFIFYHQLPRYVYVTEFGAFASLNHVDVRQRRIFAHNVTDATASIHWENRVFFMLQESRCASFMILTTISEK